MQGFCVEKTTLRKKNEHVNIDANQGGQMRLVDYLWENRLTQKQFAESLGYTRSYINMLCTGRVKVSLPVIRAIIRATNGKVTAEDLREANDK